MSSAQSLLRQGVAALLHADGVVTWTPSGPVPSMTAHPPVFETVYPDAPDVCVALATYATGEDEPTLSHSVLMLQVRTRGTDADVTAGDALDDAIYDKLAGRWPVTLPNGLKIVTMRRASSSPIGRDAAGRMERTTNYRCVVHDPGPYRG